MDRRLSDMSDLHRLWWSEFGQPAEVAVRIGTVAAAGAVLWLYNGWLFGPVWAALFIAALAVTRVSLWPEDPNHPASRAFGLGSYFVATTIYAAGPLYVIAVGDTVLQFCGFMGIIAACVYNFYRDEPPAAVQVFDIALGWVAITTVALVFIPGQDMLAAQAVMLLLCAVVGGYYTTALIKTRAGQIALREAARRQQALQEMEAVARLSGGLAQDFRRILTMIRGSLELSQKVPAGHEREDLVEEARRAVGQASALVSQLQAFARRAPLEPRALSVETVLAEVAGQARAILTPRIGLDLRLPSENVQVMADGAGLQEALLHLIRNARDALQDAATPGSGYATGTVTLGVDLVEGPATGASCAPALSPLGAHLRFSVADDGPGMAEDIAERALEPFFTTKPPGKGSGLGLPMAKGFAEQSGGAFTLETSEHGTTVSIHLPIARTPD